MSKAMSSSWGIPVSSDTSTFSKYAIWGDAYKTKRKRMDTDIDSYGIKLKVGQWVVRSSTMRIGKIVNFSANGNPRIQHYNKETRKLNTDRIPAVQIMKSWDSSIVIIDKPREALED